MQTFTTVKVQTRVPTWSKLNIFHIFEGNFFVFKELFSENYVLIRGGSFTRQVRVVNFEFFVKSMMVYS